ncbi:hypothetical protein QJS04_geneDACA014734 [Acorus gramineus]|uniref:PEP-utilising enzyme C-terminal domain-containing protein n=1 Tax=Acorus gramineus TaxID=55184 RepID=A0AAV8ZXG8_ACOGR|nr:hypothetical protein QJS04_geneDACA014734 [Acorus gramineus]
MITEQAEFFSFGTNDLTQMTFGYSRDDVGKFLPITKQAEFFSFGTNDLTHMTFGYSRDDVGKFLPVYLSKGVLQSDPFESRYA